MFFQAFDQRRIFRAGQGFFLIYHVVIDFIGETGSRLVFRFDVCKFAYRYYKLLATHTCHIISRFDAFRLIFHRGRFTGIFRRPCVR